MCLLYHPYFSVAAQLAAQSAARERIRLVLYTPLEETFSFPLGEAIVFTGSGDPWVGGAASRIPALCEERGIPCIVIPDANHSLETDDVQGDIKALCAVMERTGQFIKGAAQIERSGGADALRLRGGKERRTPL